MASAQPVLATLPPPCWNAGIGCKGVRGVPRVKPAAALFFIKCLAYAPQQWWAVLWIRNDWPMVNVCHICVVICAISMMEKAVQVYQTFISVVKSNVKSSGWVMYTSDCCLGAHSRPATNVLTQVAIPEFSHLSLVNFRQLWITEYVSECAVSHFKSKLEILPWKDHAATQTWGNEEYTRNIHILSPLIQQVIKFAIMTCYFNQLHCKRNHVSVASLNVLNICVAYRTVTHIKHDTGITGTLV